MTIRQHLASLSGTACRFTTEAPQDRPPASIYRLTEGGQERFPRRYDAWPSSRLEEVAFLDADEIAGLSGEPEAPACW